jgi:hypothetical protein
VIFYVLESDWFLKYFIFKNILKLFFYFLKIIFHIKTNGSRKNYFILLSYISLLNQSLKECLYKDAGVRTVIGINHQWLFFLQNSTDPKTIRMDASQPW